MHLITSLQIISRVTSQPKYILTRIPRKLFLAETSYFTCVKTYIRAPIMANQLIDETALNIGRLQISNSGNVNASYHTVPTDNSTYCGINIAGYKSLREWERLDGEKGNANNDPNFVLKLLSFNILAQHLLERHSYLYKEHDKESLPWEKRMPLLIQEIFDADAHVICLQEMQDVHLTDFLVPFKKRGYDYLYKKRTNDKNDGLLLLYRTEYLKLVEYSKVELYQKGVKLLNRDNVGIVAKFALKENPLAQVVVATTHLLFNPRRSDVRLGQVQLLLTEIEKFAFVEDSLMGTQYLPVILAGDFNLEPNTAVYDFITTGSIQYEGKGRNLELTDYRHLSNSLIPPHLYITDECQHLHIVAARLRKMSCQLSKPKEASEVNGMSKKIELDVNTTRYQKVELVEGHFVTFSSGLLTHPFNFNSLYKHQKKEGQPEATTYQDRWITVDYIFYTQMKPLERYTLPTAEECSSLLPTIPNCVVGSDHLCLGGSFEIKPRSKM